MEQKIIPTIIYKNEKFIIYKIINKNKHILISENGVEIPRKDFFNNQFIVICDECGKKIILQNLPNINKKFYCRHCRRLGEKNPMYHKIVSNETRKKQSDSQTGKIVKPETRIKLHNSLLGKNKGKYIGEKNPMYAKTVYDIWVKKYGKEEADKRKELKREKVSQSLSGSNNPMYGKSVYDVWIEKLGKEKADKKYKEYKQTLSDTSFWHKFNKINKQNWSKISQQIFWKIYEQICDKYESIYFGELNHEFACGTNKNFDFVVKDNKKIIEFNGDKFHANPELYKAHDIPLSFLKLHASEIWENEKIKLDKARKNGYDIKIIWESEYLKNKETIILDCINFINQ